MPTLKFSSHFESGVLPRIESDTKFLDVYKQLDEAERGGFLLVEEGKVKTYVKAYELADAVAHRALREVRRNFSISPGDLFDKLTDPDEPVSRAIADEMNRISQTPIGEIVCRMMSAIFVAVAEDWIDEGDDEPPLIDQDPRVFEVYENGEPVGWFLNRERNRATTTERPVFICGRGHKNPDGDSGTCYQCPAPIIDADR